MKGAILLGILLLIGSIGGTIYVFEQNSSYAKNDRAKDESNMPLDKVVCWGHFDVEMGITGLYPRQPGNVVMVMPENAQVKKNELMLQVDDRLAQLKIQEAEEAAKAAELQWADAKLLEPQYELQRKQQEAAIRAVGHEIKSKAFELDSKLQSLDAGSALMKTVKELYSEALAQLGEKKKAEEAKLKQMELLDAKSKIALAEIDWKAKKILVEEARRYADYFKIVAPNDGMVLRVYVREGETLGTNPRTHAIDFLPDLTKSPMIVRAEVLQEWGRFVKVGQSVVIEDDTHNGTTWEGTVKTLSKWYAPTRSPVIEPFRYNDVRTLECIITLKDGGEQKFIGQRVRARINIK